ncbi:MAG: LPS assembly lipoprotein LptE [Bdellovibrionales bacterium]
MKMLALLSLIFLTACGFHPVYGVNKYTPVGAEAKFTQIAITNIPNREGQFLRNRLIDTLHRNAPNEPKRYTLNINPIEERLRELDITIDSDTTRAQLTLTTTMKLTDKTTNKTLINRTLTSVASFNVLGSEFANRISEQSTRENVLDDLARQIEHQIALYFKRT